MNGLVWTAEQVALLEKDYLGYSASVIADRINEATGSTFTRNSVIGRTNRMVAAGILAPKIRGKQPAISRIRRARSTPFNPVRIPKAPPPPKPVRGDFLHIGFFDLKPNHCRFPEGEGWTATYCGQPKQKGSSYCAYCHSICTERPDAGAVRYTNYIARKFAA